MKSPVGPPLAGPLRFQIDSLKAGFLNALVQVCASWASQWVSLLWVAACLGRATDLRLDENLDRALARKGRVKGVAPKDAAGDGGAIVKLLSGALLQKDAKKIGKEVALAVLVVALIRDTSRKVLIEAPHRFEKGTFGLGPAGPTR
jgi:hypothetical protein